MISIILILISVFFMDTILLGLGKLIGFALSLPLLIASFIGGLFR